jgi:hypothetical protein
LKSSQVGGNTWSTGSTKDSIYVKTAASFTVSYNDGSGCSITTSAPLTTTINAIPVVSITGQTAICPGGSTTLDAGNFSSYRWSTGATTRTITVSSAATYSVTVTNASGCKGTDTATTTFSTKPTPAITGTLSFCPGGSTTLNAGTGYNSYAWTGGATTATNTVSTAGTYTVTVTNAAGCSGSASASVSTYTLPTPYITGGNGICPSGSTTLTANAGYVSYLWSSPSAAATPSINATATGSYSVTVTDNNGCVGTSATKTLVQYSNPTPTISGTLSFCGGASTTLGAGLGYGSYLWSTGETNHSINVTSVQTFSVVVTDLNGCSGSASATTTSESSIPATPGPIAGVTSSVCNSTQTYSIAPVTNANRYIWTLPDGSTIETASTSISVTFGSGFSSGNIMVAAANNCGQSGSFNPRTLAVKGQPLTPGNITGLVTGLCGKTNVAYSITPVTGATSYTWTLPAGATLASGAGTASITVNFGSTFTSGNICVTASNTCGSSTASCIFVAGGRPIMNGSITGLKTVCPKQTGVVYTIPAATGASSYTWTVPSLAIIKSGQGTNSITLDFSTKGGNVTVTATNACGTTTAQVLAVTINNTCPKQAAIVSSASTQAPEISLDKEMKAYPNPTKGLVTLYVAGNSLGHYELSVYDAAGRVVLKGKSMLEQNRTTVDLSKFAKGIYTILLTDGVKNYPFKIVLQ